MQLSQWDYFYLAVFAAGLVATLVTTPLFRAAACKLDIMDRPKNEAHKKHGKATALLGGLALFTGWGGCLVGAYWGIRWNIFPQLTSQILPYLDGLDSVSVRLWYVVAGAFGAVLLGLIDDVRGMKAGPKFFGQFLIALIAVIPGGMRASLFIGNEWVTIAASVFWFMLLMNSINFFDNMDGLAVGTVTIAMGLFGIISGLNGQYFVGSFSFLACGCGLGFWIYNHSPASIFMGDSGSHFLGYLAAAVSCSVTYFFHGQSQSHFPVLLPLFVLAIPLFDTMMVVLIRWKNGKPFWIGDHNHISHRFVKMGLSRARAVMLVHLMALTVGIGALPIMWGDYKTAAVVVAQMSLLLLIVTILQFSLSDKKN